MFEVIHPPRELPFDPQALSRIFVRLLADKVGEPGLADIRARAADPVYEERDPVEGTTPVEPLMRAALAEIGHPIPDVHDPITMETDPGPFDDASRAYWEAAMAWARRDGFVVA